MENRRNAPINPAACEILSALIGRDDGQRPSTLTQPHGFVSDDRDDGLSPPHSLVKTRLTRERYPHPYKACFVLLPNRCGTSQVWLVTSGWTVTFGIRAGFESMCQRGRWASLRGWIVKSHIGWGGE
ncbi:hypothetical protein PIB30_023599 [Stylosanthes scabra]|uniref:Uncharacterized protein n=1 Tax=Stylosanthes scabra TaxID=79078 RepID=A0ABU6Y7R5_9FABA|nr:hypothetical protein [Stylosanthes scabra]